MSSFVRIIRNLDGQTNVVSKRFYQSFICLYINDDYISGVNREAQIDCEPYGESKSFHKRTTDRCGQITNLFVHHVRILHVPKDYPPDQTRFTEQREVETGEGGEGEKGIVQVYDEGKGFVQGTLAPDVPLYL